MFLLTLHHHSPPLLFPSPCPIRLRQVLEKEHAIERERLEAELRLQALGERAMRGDADRFEAEKLRASLGDRSRELAEEKSRGHRCRSELEIYRAR